MSLDEDVDDPLELDPGWCRVLVFFFEVEDVPIDPRRVDPEPDIELPLPPVLIESDDPAPEPIELPPDIPPLEVPPLEAPLPEEPPDVCANAGATIRAAAATATINLVIIFLLAAEVAEQANHGRRLWVPFQTASRMNFLM